MHNTPHTHPHTHTRRQAWQVVWGGCVALAVVAIPHLRVAQETQPHTQTQQANHTHSPTTTTTTTTHTSVKNNWVTPGYPLLDTRARFGHLPSMCRAFGELGLGRQTAEICATVANTLRQAWGRLQGQRPACGNVADYVSDWSSRPFCMQPVSLSLQIPWKWWSC